MSITYKSQGAGAGTETNGATLNVPCPATVDANDILIAQIIHTGTTTAPTTPSGWTLLYGPANVGTTATARHWVFGKIAVGDEDGTNINFGTDGGTNGRAGRIYSFAGYVSGTITDVVPAASFSDIPHATDPQGPTVTTTVAGALAIALTCQDDNNTEEAIAGASGGTWGGFVTYVDATWGPQGIHIDIQVATPTADPGTISGGAMVAANDEASTIGFEIRDSAPVTPYIDEAPIVDLHAHTAIRSFITGIALAAQLAAGFTYNDAPVPQQSTRLYGSAFTDNQPAGINPSFDAGWDQVLNYDRTWMFVHHDGAQSDHHLHVFGNPGAAAGANAKLAAMQLISPSLKAGIYFSTTDRINAMFEVAETDLTVNFNRQQAVLKVVSEDGTVVRAILKALGNYGPNTSEWDPDVPRARIFFDNTLLDANYVTQAGDRLVLEIGGQVDGTGSSSTYTTGEVDIYSSASLVDVDDEADTGQKNSWLEISRDLEFPVFEDQASPRLQLFYPWFTQTVIEPAAGAAEVTPALDNGEFQPPILPEPRNLVWIPVDDQQLVEQPVTEPALDDGVGTPSVAPTWPSSLWLPFDDASLPEQPVIEAPPAEDYLFNNPLVWQLDNTRFHAVTPDQIASGPPTEDYWWRGPVVHQLSNTRFIAVPDDQRVEPPEVTPALDEGTSLRVYVTDPWISTFVIQSEPRTDPVVIPPPPEGIPEDGGQAVSLGPALWWQGPPLQLDADAVVGLHRGYDEPAPRPLPPAQLWPTSEKVFTDTDELPRLQAEETYVVPLPSPIQWQNIQPILSDEIVPPIPVDYGIWQPYQQQETWFPRLIVDDSDLVVTPEPAIAYEEDVGPTPPAMWQYFIPQLANWGDDGNAKVFPSGIVDEVYGAPTPEPKGWSHPRYVEWHYDQIATSFTEEAYWLQLPGSPWWIAARLAIYDSSEIQGQSYLDDQYQQTLAKPVQSPVPQLVLDTDEVVPQPEPLTVSDDYWLSPPAPVTYELGVAIRQMQLTVENDTISTLPAETAQVEGIVIEVLWLVPLQPVRMTMTYNAFLGTSELTPVRVTSIYASAIGTDALAPPRMTHLHVDAIGTDAVKSAHMTFLHVDMLRAKVPQPPEPPEPCPTTEYECVVSPATPYECVVVAPVTCEGLEPEVRIVPEEPPCPPIEGEPLPGSELVDIVRRLNDEGEIMYLLRRPKPSDEINRPLIDTDTRPS